MRNKIYVFMVLVLLLSSITTSYILYDYNEKLNKEIEIKDILLADIKSRDSTYTAETKEYSDIITKYVDNCEFSIGNKKISTDDLVKLVNTTLEKNRLLSDSIFLCKQQLESEKINLEYYKNNFNIYRDSTFILKTLNGLSKQKYGINYKVIKDTSGYLNIKNIFSKTDSALLLLPYYRNKIKYDSASNSWLIFFDREIQNKVERSDLKRK